MKHLAVLCIAGICALAVFPAHAAQTGWRGDMGTFRIGLVAPDGRMSARDRALVREAFSSALGMPVDIFQARNFPALIDAQAAGHVDYAVYSAVAFIAAVRYCGCVEPLAAPVSQGGATGLRAVVLSRADAAPGSGEAGRIAMAAGGSLGPLAAFDIREAGLRGRIVQFQTPEEALSAFLQGDVEAMAGHVLTGPGGDMEATGTVALLQARGLAPSGLAIAWRGPVIGFGPHTVRTTLSGEAKSILRDVLTGLAGRPDVLEALSPRFTGGFRPVRPIDYTGAAELLDRLLSAETKEPAGD